MPLIPYVSPEDLDGEARRLWDERAALHAVPTSYRSFLNSPGAAVQVTGLGRYLRFESDLDPRARELAVLVVNRALDSEYGWVHHELLAQEMGIPQHVIDAVRDDEEPDGLPEVQHLAWMLAVETMKAGRATRGTVRRLVDVIGRASTTDLILVVGYYTLLAQYFRTLELELLPDSLDGSTDGPDVARARATARP